MTDQHNTPRSCANCACFSAMQPDGTVIDPADAPPTIQRVCRRNPPGGRMTRLEVPVFDEAGKPVLRRPGGPQRTEMRDVLQIGYPPADVSGVCFDGWRPLDTLPGDNFKLTSIERVLLPMLGQLANGITQDQVDKMLAEMLAQARSPGAPS